MPTVLIVEDELKIRELLRGFFERDGFAVVSTASGAEAIDLVASSTPDLVVLDLGLPDVSGEAVAVEARERGLPVLILTARSGEDDRIHGLELGADDYVTKPFSPREVLLRARVILRRSTERDQSASVASYGAGTLLIDDARHEVTVAGAVVDVTATEFGLLHALAQHPGRVYSRAELMNRVRGYEVGSERAVDSHVKNLRRKIETDAGHPRIIETVVGVGYRLGLSRD